jgi:hypothetical protein
MEAPAGVERITLVTEILHQMAFLVLKLKEYVESERAPIISLKNRCAH